MFGQKTTEMATMYVVNELMFDSLPAVVRQIVIAFAFVSELCFTSS